MSREDLSAMLTELADDVSHASLAGPAVVRAVRIRRRRRAVAGAALALVVASTVGFTLLRPTHGRPEPIGPPSGGPQPTATGSARVDRLPGNLAEDPDGAPFWPRSLQPPADAPSLAEAPMSHVVLLYSSNSVEPGNQAPQIYAYGERTVNGGSGNGIFRWARVAVDLTYARDVDGNRHVPLGQNSLGPMAAGGQLAAFPQPDSLVLVNLANGVVDRIPLPGFNEDVSWLINGRHVLVSSATATWLVDTCYQTHARVACVEPRPPTRAAASGWAVAALVGGGTGLTTLAMPESGSGPPVVRFHDDGGLEQHGERSVDTNSAAPYQISYLVPRGWRYGNLIAQAAGGLAGSTRADLVIVVDSLHGTVRHVLDLAYARNIGCCRVLGWQNDDSVLVYTDQEGLLNWRLSTGAVTWLAKPAGVVAVATRGCDYSVTIAGLTAGCTT